MADSPRWPTDEPAEQNAQRIAEALEKHRRLSEVMYPTLVNDPEQVRLQEAVDFPGATFDRASWGKAAAFDFLRHIKIGRTPSLSVG